MDSDKYRFIIFLVCLCLSLTGCTGCLQTNESSIKVDLTDKEVQLEKSLSAQYKCQVKLTHSPFVKTHPNETSNALYVVFRDTEKNIPDSYCKKDSLFLDSISQLIAHKVYSVMSYKKNYDRIDLIYRDPGVCDQLIEVSIKNLQLQLHK